MQEKDIINAKKELADLYLILKSGNSKDVNNISFDLILQEIDSEQKEKELNNLIKKPLKELIDYIKNSIDIIISIKLNEAFENNKQNNNLNPSREYEILLQKEEKNNREHISVEHQLRIQCEKFAQELDSFEEEKTILLIQIVSLIFFYYIIIQESQKNEFKEKIEKLNNQILELTKSKQNNDKIIESYKLKLNIKDDEINKLKEKNLILTKKIKNFENRKFIIINNSIDNNSCSESYFVSSNREPSDLSKNIRDKMNMKKIYKFNPSFHSSINNNNVINKKIINRKMSLPTFNFSQLDLSSLINKKKSKKENSINDSVSLFFNKIEQNIYGTNNNSRNNMIKNYNITKSIKLEQKGKNPVNITNNNYNNRVLINLNTINLEKLKLQKKLAEYRKIIDKRINSLKRNYKLNSNRKNNKSMKIEKEQKYDKNDSFKDCKNKRDRSCFVKKKIFDKINISYKKIKRDNSCNIEGKKRK